MAKLLNDSSIATITTLNDAHFINIINDSTGEIQKITVANASTQLSSTRVYVAIVSQSGSSAPTNDFTVANTTGLTFTWARTATGTYTLTASGAFFNGTVIPVFTANVGAFGFIIQYDFTSSTILTIYVRSVAGSFVDSALDHATIKLERYV